MKHFLHRIILILTYVNMAGLAVGITCIVVEWKVYDYYFPQEILVSVMSCVVLGWRKENYTINIKRGGLNSPMYVAISTLKEIIMFVVCRVSI